MALCWAHVGLKTTKGADPFFIDFSVPWASKSRFWDIFEPKQSHKNLKIGWLEPVGDHRTSKTPQNPHKPY